MKTFFNAASHPKINALALSILSWISFLFLLFVFGFFIIPLFPHKWERFLYGITGSASALFVVWFLLKKEKRTPADIGLAWEYGTVSRFIKGLLAGAVIFGLIILVLINFTEIEFEENARSFTLTDAFWYLSILPLAFMEEVAFRSYAFLKLEKAFEFRTTQVIVAIAFALYHVAGGQSLYSAFIGPGVWAFVFGLAAATSRGIALPLGIHTALNILQPLTGMKSGAYASLWVIKNGQGVGNSLVRSTTAGIIIQLIVLVSAIILTEIFLRKTLIERDR